MNKIKITLELYAKKYEVLIGRYKNERYDILFPEYSYYVLEGSGEIISKINNNYNENEFIKVEGKICITDTGRAIIWVERIGE